MVSQQGFTRRETLRNPTSTYAAVQVSEAVATELSERADMVVQFAYNQLRWACAQMGEGKLQGAQDNLLSGIQSLETGLRNKEGIPSELAAELMFYAALLQLYASRDAADVAEIGQHMRQVRVPALFRTVHACFL